MFELQKLRLSSIHAWDLWIEDRANAVHGESNTPLVDYKYDDIPQSFPCVVVWRQYMDRQSKDFPLVNYVQYKLIYLDDFQG